MNLSGFQELCSTCWVPRGLSGGPWPGGGVASIPSPQLTRGLDQSFSLSGTAKLRLKATLSARCTSKVDQPGFGKIRPLGPQESCVKVTMIYDALGDC